MAMFLEESFSISAGLPPWEHLFWLNARGLDRLGPFQGLAANECRQFFWCRRESLPAGSGEMIDRGANLSVSRSIVSSEGDLLFASGICDHIMTSWFSQGIVWGVSKVMRHHVESGLARYEEWSHMGMGMRYRAGAMGVPFLPMRSMLGSDVAEHRPEARKIDCPFTGEQVLLVPALNPSVAIIHVQRCDAYGNAQLDGLQFMDLDLAMAADKVILTTERVVSNDQI